MPKKWNPDGEDWIDYGLGGYLKSADYAEEVYTSRNGQAQDPVAAQYRPAADTPISSRPSATTAFSNRWMEWRGSSISMPGALQWMNT